MPNSTFSTEIQLNDNTFYLSYIYLSLSLLRERERDGEEVKRGRDEDHFSHLLVDSCGFFGGFLYMGLWISFMHRYNIIFSFSIRVSFVSFSFLIAVARISSITL